MGANDSYKGIGAPPIVLPMDALTANDANQRFRLGQKVQDINGNEFRYIKATEALARGELVTATAIAAWDSTIVVDGAIALADLTKTLHVDTLASAMTKNQYQGYYVKQAAAASKGRMFKIASHEAGEAAGEVDIILEDTIDEVIADGAVLSIFNPYVVELTDAATEPIMGVAIGVVAAASFGFVQVGGMCQAVLCDGSNGAAVVQNEPIVPYATDPGQGQGMAGSAEADIMEAANSPLIALEASSTDAAFVPAFFLKTN
jgi:hypothetical protein